MDADIAKRSVARHIPHGDYGFGSGDAGFGGDDPYMIWEKKYIFVKDMLPVFVNEEFGRKVRPEAILCTMPDPANRANEQIFITGKSINFIRFSCQDSDWTSVQAQSSVHDAGGFAGGSVIRRI